MQISFGTPPVQFTAEADTGSDLIWLHCSACLTGNCSVFDPTASSTYQPAPCDDLACQVLSNLNTCELFLKNLNDNVEIDHMVELLDRTLERPRLAVRMELLASSVIMLMAINPAQVATWPLTPSL
jgi:hypothetical protein